MVHVGNGSAAAVRIDLVMVPRQAMDYRLQRGHRRRSHEREPIDSQFMDHRAEPEDETVLATAWLPFVLGSPPRACATPCRTRRC